jgi:hypothetical protein
MSRRPLAGRLHLQAQPSGRGGAPGGVSTRGLNYPGQAPQHYARPGECQGQNAVRGATGQSGGVVWAVMMTVVPATASRTGLCT